MALSFSQFSHIHSPKFVRSFPIPLSMMFLALLALSAFFVYGYSLRMAITYAVEREDITEKIALARASITILDNTYADLARDLSITHAKNLGFHEVADPLYISLSPPPEVASLRVR